MQRVRRACRTRAVGHTGTLDPFATGLLVTLIGRATRLARHVEGQPKTYLATARLGGTTDTDDLTGTVIESRGMSRPVTKAEIRLLLEGFLGPQQQRPPAFSAKHVAGERSYRLARRGELLELPAVSVDVLAVELVEFETPDLTFRITVSSGTYIRAIARDLGERLGTGAYLVALRRESIGALQVTEALALDDLDADTPLLAPEAVLGQLPMLEIDGDAALAVGHGRQVPAGPGMAGTVGLMNEGRLIAVGEIIGESIHPRVVLVPAA